ncbi:MAG: TlpA disulfide reductase family protein, partial [Sphaerochaetaceae bacterium]|nr:TlpA disulfide reductase family protein [Sphaerochaetaceae bacterium]
QAPESKSLAPFWTLDLEENEITETIFSPYQLTLVNIWATFCSPCLQEMPALAELRNEFASKNVNIIGIVTDVYHSNQKIFAENRNTANYIIDQTGADYIHLLPSQDLVNLRLKDSQVVPETFFVDSTGKIVGQTYYGARNKNAWKKIIESTLSLVE